jgi:hypothetical protein
MPDITVQRHGERWAVIPAGAESAAEEHETREAAEMSARGLAAGGRVDVREDDPTNLDEAPETTRQSDSPTVGGVTADHLTRSQQSGT